MLCMQNEKKIDLINSQEGVLHRLLGAEGRAGCHWESNLLEGCQSAWLWFGFSVVLEAFAHGVYKELLSMWGLGHPRSAPCTAPSACCLCFFLWMLGGIINSHLPSLEDNSGTESLTFLQCFKCVNDRILEERVLALLWHVLNIMGRWNVAW